MPQEGGKVWNRIIPGGFLNQVYHFGGAYYKDENILGSILGSPYSGNYSLEAVLNPGVSLLYSAGPYLQVLRNKWTNSFESEKDP